MGRRRNSHRQPTKRDFPHRDQAVSKADDQGCVQREPTCSDDGLTVSVSAASNFYRVLAVCTLLLLATGLVFGQTVRYEFVNFDDNKYVYDNPSVSRGLSASGMAWAFTHSHAANWHPLTWISLMLDCQLYGLSAGGHHLTNVLLHAATAILLFLVLRQMTGRFWPSAVVAAIFAVHPLRVESVAWVAERKDVLSGLFFVLTLGAYVRYVRGSFSLGRYLLIVAVFALGLMAKPMLVTLPLVLLLLDYWPLGRTAFAATGDAPEPRGGRAGRVSFPLRLVVEKLPLLLLTAASCAATVWAQSGALAVNESLRFGPRLANALVSYVAYMVQLFYPLGLAVFYPHPGADLPIWKVVGAVVVLTMISAGVLACWRRCPYLLVGWLWYVGMLLPVIGLAQVGGQQMADRYTYLPQIGLCIALTWGVADLCRSSVYRRWMCSVASTLLLVVLMGCAWRQTSFWQDNETLWARALACTTRNRVAHYDLGNALAARGRFDEAMVQYRKALEIKPDYTDARYSLGLALQARERMDEAIVEFQQTVAIKPDFAEAHNSLGAVLANRGRLDEAIAQYRRALAIKPDYAEARKNLGIALAAQGHLDEALAHCQGVLKIDPGAAEAHYNLAFVLARLGRLDEAVAHYRKGLEAKPDDAEAHYHLGLALQAQGKIDEALGQYQRAVEIKPGYAEARNNFGAALQARGRVDEALAQYRQALKIRPDYAKVYYNMGTAWAGRGRFDEAIAQFQRAIELNPDDADAQNNLAWLLATSAAASLRNGAAAVEHAQRANRLCGGRRADVLGTLAAAYAEAGRFPEALAAARKAVELATQQHNHVLATALHARIALYETGKPSPTSPTSLGPPSTRP